MDAIKKTCDHVIGVCLNNSYGGAGTLSLLKVSKIKDALDGAREFYAQSVDSEVQYLPESEADKIFDDKMGKFDSKPILWRLKKNSVLYAYCPTCGADLEPVFDRIGSDE